MEDVVASFPLLQLPFSTQQRVSRFMDGISQLAFSILSKKAASLVKSLKTELDFVTLSIGNDIELEIQSGQSVMSMFFEYGEGELEPVEKCPERLSFKYYSWEPERRGELDEDTSDDEEESIWSTNFTLRDWILHIQNIYHDSQIRELDFKESIVFDLISIKMALRDIEISEVSIGQMDNDELFKKVTEHFLPAKEFTIAHVPEDNNHLQRVSLSNFDSIYAISSRFPYFESLDGLLTINASNISINFFAVSDKTINKFLKLWIKGAMPRLRHMLIQFVLSPMIVKKEVILNKIRYTERQWGEERSRTFEYESDRNMLRIKRGFNILRFDGVEATIQLRESEDRVDAFEFSVWNQ